MKLHEGTRDVTISGEKTTSDFKIATSSKAFKILSDGIYSDKIQAIIRELSTNAFDSHVDAGKKDAPFDVHFPTGTQPWFSVRDYGTGMSKEKIETLYTTYFDSDRNNSNDFTGALGLGSKSPFAYTDSFTVESHFNGEKYIYNCLVNNNGQPQVSLLFEGETTEPNGVEVKFSVSDSDFRDFHQKASFVFYPFDVKPNLTGQNIELPPKNVVLSGNGWQIVTRGSYRSEALAIQGNVAYKINSQSLPESLRDEKIVSLIDSVNIDIDFPMGSLDVSASRESLGYDSITTQNIFNRLSEVVGELQSLVDSISNKSENYWDAVKNINSFIKGVRGVSNVISVTSYKGSEINVGKRFHFTLPISGIVNYTRKSNSSLGRDVSIRGVISFAFSDVPLIVVDDEGNNTNRKCLMKTRAYFKNSEYTRVWIIPKEDWKASFKSKLHNIPVLYSTKLPKPKYTRSKSNNNYHKTMVDVRKNWSSFDFVDYTQVDFDTFALYVDLKNNRFIYEDENFDINPYIKFLNMFGFSDIKVYGVKTVEKSKSRFKKSKWVNIVEFVNSKIEDVAKEYESDLKDFKTLVNNHISYRTKELFNSKNAEKVDKNSPFFDVMNSVYKLEVINKRFSDESLRNKINNILSLFDAFKIKVEHEELNLSDKIENFYSNYPLLETSRNINSKVAIEYINAIDSYRGRV